MNSTKDIAKVNRVINAVCEEFDVTRDLLFSSTREQHYVFIRHCLIYTIKRVLNINISLAKLGSIVNRDHATILYSCNTAFNLILTDNNEFVKYMKRVIRISNYAKKEESINFTSTAQL